MDIAAQACLAPIINFCDAMKLAKLGGASGIAVALRWHYGGITVAFRRVSSAGYGAGRGLPAVLTEICQSEFCCTVFETCLVLLL